MASRYNITSTVQRVNDGVLEPGNSASALITDPSGTPITVYAAETGPSTVTNPVTTTLFGRIEGWVGTPDYNIIVSGPGITTYTEYIRLTPQGTVAVLESTALNWGTGFGVSDTNLYRRAANVLKTDDTFEAARNILARATLNEQVSIGDVGPGGTSGITFGAASDTNLYRSASNQLDTDDNFYAHAGVRAGNWGSKAAFWSTQTSGLILLQNLLLLADAHPSFQITGLGVISWGGGGAIAPDTTLYRNAAGALTTDGSLTTGTALNIGGALNHDGTTVGLYGVTPIVQEAGWGTPTSGSLTGGAYRTPLTDASTLLELKRYVTTLAQRLKNVGVIGT